jgi:hypothetical protein
VSAVGVLATSIVTAHRQTLISAAPPVGAFSAGGLADHNFAETSAGAVDPDRLLVVEFLLIRDVSANIGTRNAVNTLFWIFFGLLRVRGLGVPR